VKLARFSDFDVWVLADDFSSGVNEDAGQSRIADAKPAG
jgi:hypothetical protein